jgi:hypothetical protein
VPLVPSSNSVKNLAGVAQTLNGAAVPIDAFEKEKRLKTLVNRRSNATDACAHSKSSPGILVTRSARIGRYRMRPAASAARDIGGSLFSDK